MTTFPFLVVHFPGAVQVCQVMPGWVSVCWVPTCCPWAAAARRAVASAMLRYILKRMMGAGVDMNWDPGWRRVWQIGVMNWRKLRFCTRSWIVRFPQTLYTHPWCEGYYSKVIIKKAIEEDGPTEYYSIWYGTTSFTSLDECNEAASRWTKVPERQLTPVFCILPVLYVERWVDGEVSVFQGYERPPPF